MVIIIIIIVIVIMIWKEMCVRVCGGELVIWYRLTSLVQVSSLTNVGQPTGGVREMLNATAVAIGQGRWRLIRKEKGYRHEPGQLRAR